MDIIKKDDVQTWLLSELPGGDVVRDHMDALSVLWWTCDCGITRKRINGSVECPRCGGLDLGIQFAMIHERENREMIKRSQCGFDKIIY